MAHYNQVYDFYESNANARGPYHRITHSQYPSDHRIPNAGKQSTSASTTELEMYAINPQLTLQDTPTHPQPRTLQPQPWQRRIGYLGFWILGLGTIVTLASCAFLVYFWNGAALARKGLPRPWGWDRIVFGGYAAQVAALCSTAIQSSVEFQLAMLAAAMAAIILERRGTRLSDLASLSMSKAFIDTASSWEIFLIASRKLPNRKNIVSYWLLPLLAVLVGIAMSITSFILLTDLKMVDIAGPSITQSIALGLDLDKVIADPAGTSYWQSKPLAHWRFAEARPSTTSNDTLKHVSDTGDIYRASLPFETLDNRTSLEQYHGPAIVGNVRTACVAPIFTNASLEYVFTGNPITEGLYLHSEIDTLASWESGPKINGSQFARISCRLNNYWDETSASWPLSLCSFMNIDRDTSNGSMKNPLSSRPYEFQPLLLLNSSSILNVNLVIPQWTGSTENWAVVSAPDTLRLSKFDKDGPWTSAIASNGTEVFKASLCFTALNIPFLYNVTMLGSAIPSEPKTRAKYRNLNQTSGKESDLLKQLGIGTTPSDFKTRGVLGLKIHSGPESLATRNFDEMEFAIYSLIRESIFDYSISGGWTFNNDALMGHVESVLFWPAHQDHSYLVQTILNRTADPALAIQALFSRFYQMISHDMLPYWTRQQSIVTVSAQKVVLPSQWTGLIAVLILIIIHYALMLVVIVLFLASTKVSLLGNTWQAVSQIVSPETDGIIKAATNSGMTDKEIESWVKTAESDITIVSPRLNTRGHI
ncbi:hypothetical protein FLONG3_1127 [Fusarium longipes]|uniref:Uncharacterized protein n=1 Tax=Fusarium longipes TaxID=694270 RepID=A0A395T8L1_9HYPO|nr:hypothetical protein FLONG3_1127 [Fusarium longipes]